jgi:thioredoxin-related protein
MFQRRLLVAALVLLRCAAGLHADGVAWRTDLKAATAEAAKTGKLLMVDVYTDWCGWCKKLDKDTYADAKVAQKLGGLVALKLNPEQDKANEEFAHKYGVSGYPTILFLEPDGTLANKVVGYLDAPSFLSVVTRTSDYTPLIKKYLAELGTPRPAHARELLTMLAELGRTDDAIRVFDKTRAALEPAVQAGIGLSIAKACVGDNRYEEAIRCLAAAEGPGSDPDTKGEGYLLHSIALFYTQGKKAGIAYLDGKLSDESTPAPWKSRYDQLRGRMLEVKDE